MADEKQQEETLDDIRRKVQNRRYEPEEEDADVDESDEAKESPDADEPAEDEESVEPEDSEEDAADEEPSDDDEESVEDDETEEDEEGQPEEPAVEAESEEDESTEADRPEGEEPPEAEEPSDEDDPVILEFHGNQKFRRSDLDDPDRLAEYREAVKASLMMQAEFTRKTQEQAEQRRQVQQAHQALQQRQALMLEMARDEDMQKILSEFGGDPLGDGTTLAQRMLLNPTDTRRILADPAAKERLWDKMEALRANPAEREQIAEMDRTRRQNAEYQRQVSTTQAGQELQGFVAALDQTIDNFADDAGVDADDVTEFVLNVAGLTPSDLKNVQNLDETGQARVVNGLLMLKQTFLRRDQNGQGYIAPDLIQREVQRLKRFAGTQASGDEPDGEKPKKGGSKKAEAHNKAVREKLAEDDDPDPAPVPPGSPPGDEDEAEAENYKDVRNRVQERARRARV